MRDIGRIKLVLRTMIFIFAFAAAIWDIDLLKGLFSYGFGYFRTYHIIWLLLITEMLFVCIPSLNRQVSCGKLFARHYRETALHYDENALKAHTRLENRRAAIAALLWFAALSAIGALYFTVIKDKIYLHLAVVLFYFGDQVAINIWCPIRAWIISNKCCTTCRIYNWDNMMIFSPYIFLPSIWTWTILGLAAFILVQWEYMHHKHPQRFAEISNLNLGCRACRKKKCRLAGKKDAQTT